MRFRTVLCLPLAAAVFTGCFGNSSEPDPNAPQERPFVGRTVRVVAPHEIAERPDWQIMLDEWGEQTGAEWTLTPFDFTSGDSLPDHDVLVLPTSNVQSLGSTAPLAPIPLERQGPERLAWLDLFQGLRERVASIDGKPAVVPVSSPVLVLYYRRDLLENAGLRPPETWADYQTLLEKLDEWAPGLTAVEPWGEEFRATMFLARAASYAKHPGNYSFDFDISTGDPLIGTPGFARALEDAVKAVAKMPVEVRTFSPADCRRAFFEGRAALAIAYETGPGNPILPGGRPDTGSNEEREETSARDDTDSDASRPSHEFSAGFVRLPGSREVYNPSSERWESPPGQGVNRVTLADFREFFADPTGRVIELRGPARSLGPGERRRAILDADHLREVPRRTGGLGRNRPRDRDAQPRKAGQRDPVHPLPRR